MKRLVVLGAATATLVASMTLAGASAPAPTTVIHDSLSAAGLGFQQVDCVDPTREVAQEVRLENAVGPGVAPSGKRSVTWQGLSAGTAAGPSVRVTDPSTLTSLSVTARHTSTALAGVALAMYYPADGSTYWQGVASLGQDTQEGWHTIQAASLTFAWREYSADGDLLRSGGALPLRDFVSSNGGDAGGAEVGLLFGCNGEDFFLDEFEVTTASTSKVWDFEGAPSEVDARPETKRLTFGEQLRFDVSVESIASLEALQLDLEARYAGARKTKNLGGYAYEAGSPVVFQPLYSGRYRLAVPETNNIERSTSAWRDIAVAFQVKSRPTTARLKQGDSFAVSGRIFPAGRDNKVVVKRRTAKGWTAVAAKAVRRGTSYRIQVRPNMTGRQTFAVFAAQTDRNAGAKGKPFRVTVKPRPTSNGGGSDDGGGSTGGTGDGGDGGGGGNEPPSGPQRPAT